MKISAVNPSSYQPNFGKIYVPKGSYFSENQQKTVDKIIETLRTPNETYKNKTPEKYWENKGISFNIKGYDRDSVSLEALVGAKEVGTGMDRHVITPGRGSSFGIGVYDEQYPFKPEDVKAGLKEWHGNINAFFAVTVIAILGLLLVALGGRMKAQDTVKPLIENVVNSVK